MRAPQVTSPLKSWSMELEVLNFLFIGHSGDGAEIDDDRLVRIPINVPLNQFQADRHTHLVGKAGNQSAI